MARADALTRGNLHEQLEEVFSKLPLGPRSAIFMTVDCAERGFGDRCHLRAAPPFASPHRHNPLLCASAHASCSYRPFVTRALVLACAELWHWSTCAVLRRAIAQLVSVALACPANRGDTAPQRTARESFTPRPTPCNLHASPETLVVCNWQHEMSLIQRADDPFSLSPPFPCGRVCLRATCACVYLCMCVSEHVCVCVFRPARSCLHM